MFTFAEFERLNEKTQAFPKEIMNMTVAEILNKIDTEAMEQRHKLEEVLTEIQKSMSLYSYPNDSELSFNTSMEVKDEPKQVEFDETEEDEEGNVKTYNGIPTYDEAMQPDPVEQKNDQTFKGW